MCLRRRLEQIIHKLLVEPVQAKGAHFMVCSISSVSRTAVVNVNHVQQMIFDCCHSASMAGKIHIRRGAVFLIFMPELPYHSFGSLAPDAAQSSSTTVGKVETQYGLKERSGASLEIHLGPMQLD